MCSIVIFIFVVM